MQITSLNPNHQIEVKTKSESLKAILQSILNIGQHDTIFGNPVASTPEPKNQNLEITISKQKKLLEQSIKMKKNLDDSIEELEQINFKKKVTILEQLGSDL